MTVRVWRSGTEVELTVAGRDLHGRLMIGVMSTAVSGYLPVLLLISVTSVMLKLAMLSAPICAARWTPPAQWA